MHSLFAKPMIELKGVGSKRAELFQKLFWIHNIPLLNYILISVGRHAIKREILPDAFNGGFGLGDW